MLNWMPQSLVIVAAVALAAPAAAVTTQFYGQGVWGPDAPVTGHSAPGAIFSFSFTLATPLPPDAGIGDPYEVINPGLPIFLINGIPNYEPLEQVIFYNFASGGLFDLIFSVDDINLFGPDVGSTGVLSYGVFAVDYGIGGERGFGSGSLAITAVPEPASWTLLVAGFGLIGTAVRRRRTVALAE